MNKSKLRQLVREVVGHSKYAPGGTTKGGTTDDFRNILTEIVNDRPEQSGKYQGDPINGHKILNRGNPNILFDKPEGTLSAAEIKEFVKQTLKLQDYDVDVRFYPNQKEIKLTIKQDPSVEDFNTVIEYLQDNGYTVNEKQSRREGDDDDGKYNYPRIVFT